MYHATTRDIRVQVEPTYLEEQSTPDENHFVWAYTIQIENQGPETVRLQSRYWCITDSTGNVQEVKGNGVVGEQPVLQPGEWFKYTSGAPLPTPTGFVGGTYQMVTKTGESFDIKIPTFSLDSPYQDYNVH